MVVLKQITSIETRILLNTYGQFSGKDHTVFQILKIKDLVIVYFKMKGSTKKHSLKEGYILHIHVCITSIMVAPNISPVLTMHILCHTLRAPNLKM